jgi:hypothetical protein
MAGTGFERTDYLQCCKFAEGDSRILMQVSDPSEGEMKEWFTVCLEVAGPIGLQRERGREETGEEGGRASYPSWKAE